MELTPGTSFVTVGDPADPSSVSGIMTVAKVDRDYVYAEGYDAKEGKGIYNRGFCIPALYAERMRDVCRERKALKDAYDNSMSLVYKLMNEWKNA